jgi:hypothetical protein
MAVVLLATVWGPICRADSMSYCDRPVTHMTGAQADRMLSFGTQVIDFLNQSGASAVIISRSGFDLSRFDLHYSHSGIGLPDEARHTWHVRQLYFDCGESRPRIYDQGVLGFTAGNEPDRPAFVSLVFLPPDKEAEVVEAARSNPVSLSLLGASYSADAYAFSTEYQNCNQWVAELLAVAWQGKADPAMADEQPRQQAQDWLRTMHYQPTAIPVKRWMLWAGWVVPHMHRDDHPAEDLDRLQLKVSMPGSIEDFVQTTVPGASRVEFCLKDSKIIVRKGWKPLDADCTPEDQDEVMDVK